MTPNVDAFCRRVKLTIADGGFAMVTGVPALENATSRARGRATQHVAIRDESQSYRAALSLCSEYRVTRFRPSRLLE